MFAQFEDGPGMDLERVLPSGGGVESCFREVSWAAVWLAEPLATSWINPTSLRGTHAKSDFPRSGLMRRSDSDGSVGDCGRLLGDVHVETCRLVLLCLLL